MEPAGPRAGGHCPCGNHVASTAWRLSARRRAGPHAPSTQRGGRGVSSTAWRAGGRATPIAATAWSAVRESSCDAESVRRWRGENRATERQRIEHTHNRNKKRTGRGRRRGLVLRLRVHHRDGLRSGGGRRRGGRGPRALCGDCVDEIRCGHRRAVSEKRSWSRWVVIILCGDRGLGGGGRDPR